MTKIIKSNEDPLLNNTDSEEVMCVDESLIVPEYFSNMEQTVNFMNSNKYKERFIAEYIQTKMRYEKLHKLIVKHDAGSLDFELTCPILILKNQASFMGQYLQQLEIRAEIEHITLPATMIK